jgi:hypothetical protein
MDFSLIIDILLQQQDSLPHYDNLYQFTTCFYQFWQELGRKVQEQLIQSQIEEAEAKYEHPRTKKKKIYYTPLGEMEIKRRGYQKSNGIKFLVDNELGLPQEKWLPSVLELACALGVSSEFPNSHKLFTQWTNIDITEKTLANQVEKIGNKLQEKEFIVSKKSKEKTEKSTDISSEEIIYLGVDGVMTPLNQKQGYKEAKVGVIFYKKDHQKKHKKGIVRHKEYIATLKSRNEFTAKINQLYQETSGGKKHQTVVIGDGAHWIWEMAEKHYPNGIQILDFYHLSEYVWKVAKTAFLNNEEKQKKWVNTQQQLLKKSQWKSVINNCEQIKGKRQELREALKNLIRYLTNNKERIDYQKYLKLGLMIGSGVVESSNRRVVTQRLKQAGMHWSKQGAEGVMALRASYLSSSNRWSDFYSNQCHICS